jgi:hypothetical protein
VLGMLQIVFSHHAIAGTLRIARELHVFVGNLLRIATDFDVRAIALIAARQRIWTAFAIAAIVVVIIVIVVVTAAHAPVLLLWPHSTLILVVLKSTA